MQHSAIRKAGHHAYSARRDAPLAGCMRACEVEKGLLAELIWSCMLSWRRSAAACSSLFVPDRLGWAVAELEACSPLKLIGKDATFMR